MTDENERKDKEGKSSDTLRKALIGLFGTLLTICGGLTGALVSASVTIYAVERSREQVVLVAPNGPESLRVDTRQIAISLEEALQLDPGQYDVDEEAGFVLAHPRAGWQQERLVYADLFREPSPTPLIFFYSLAGLAWDDQPVHRVRIEPPARVQLQNGSTIHHYNHIAVLAVDKEVAPNQTLADIALAWGKPQAGTVNQLIAERESDTILVQASWQFEDAEIDGRRVNIAIERWALFAEGPGHYYVVELDYMPAASRSMQTWEDLQAYMDSFRTIR